MSRRTVGVLCPLHRELQPHQPSTNKNLPWLKGNHGGDDTNTSVLPSPAVLRVNSGGDVNEMMPPLLLHSQDIVSLNELILLNPPVLISWETGWERCFPKEALPGQQLYIPISSSHLLPFLVPPGTCPAADAGFIAAVIISSWC